MDELLTYKISTKIGTTILAIALIFSVALIYRSAVAKSIGDMDNYRKIERKSIEEATGENMDNANVNNWLVYSNIKYGFKTRYPETASGIKDENIRAYAEEYFETPVAYLKVSFGSFSIKAWENPDDFELGKYLASEGFCASDRAFCRSYKVSDRIMLAKKSIAGKEWYQTADRAQRFFIASPDNKYFLDFELVNLNYNKEFDKILSTLVFAKNVND